MPSLNFQGIITMIYKLFGNDKNHLIQYSRKVQFKSENLIKIIAWNKLYPVSFIDINV